MRETTSSQPTQEETVKSPLGRNHRFLRPLTPTASAPLGRVRSAQPRWPCLPCSVAFAPLRRAGSARSAASALLCSTRRLRSLRSAAPVMPTPVGPVCFALLGHVRSALLGLACPSRLRWPRPLRSATPAATRACKLQLYSCVQM